jgi:hypothetical protein
VLPSFNKKSYSRSSSLAVALGVFDIKCPKGKQDCRLTPFNPGLLGYGPGPACDKAGLLLPSHRNGLVSAEKDKPSILSVACKEIHILRVYMFLLQGTECKISILLHFEF